MAVHVLRVALTHGGLATVACRFAALDPTSAHEYIQGCEGFGSATAGSKMKHEPDAEGNRRSSRDRRSRRAHGSVRRRSSSSGARRDAVERSRFECCGFEHHRLKRGFVERDTRNHRWAYQGVCHTDA